MCCGVGRGGKEDQESVKERKVSRKGAKNAKMKFFVCYNDSAKGRGFQPRRREMASEAALAAEANSPLLQGLKPNGEAPTHGGAESPALSLPL